MTEADLLRKEGQLISDKQYVTTIRLVFISLIISGVITFAGAITAMATRIPNIVKLGLLLGVVGFILLLFSVVFAFKKALKIQLYRRYIANPEDFETEI